MRRVAGSAMFSPAKWCAAQLARRASHFKRAGAPGATASFLSLAKMVAMRLNWSFLPTDHRTFGLRPPPASLGSELSTENVARPTLVSAPVVYLTLTAASTSVPSSLSVSPPSQSSLKQSRKHDHHPASAAITMSHCCLLPGPDQSHFTCGTIGGGTTARGATRAPGLFGAVRVRARTGRSNRFSPRLGATGPKTGVGAQLPTVVVIGATYAAFASRSSKVDPNLRPPRIMLSKCAAALTAAQKPPMAA